MLLPNQTRGLSIAGRAMSGLVVLFLLMDAGMKLAALSPVLEISAQIGWPATPEMARMLGLILIVPTLLYVWPRTAVLGALLITAYLGGACATHVRIGSPLFSHVLFGVYIGLLLWGGLWLRDPRLRALLPVTSAKDATS